MVSINKSMDVDEKSNIFNERKSKDTLREKSSHLEENKHRNVTLKDRDGKTLLGRNCKQRTRETNG